MSAAIEGGIEGIPSIGFSLCDYSHNADFTAAGKYITSIAKNVLTNKLPENIVLNVNIPKADEKELKGIKICRQANALWEEEFDKRTDPKGKNYYWLTGKWINLDKGDDTDEWALTHNYISIVPVRFDMTAFHCLEKIKQWNFDI